MGWARRWILTVSLLLKGCFLPCVFPLLPAELVKGEIPSLSTQALKTGWSSQCSVSYNLLTLRNPPGVEESKGLLSDRRRNRSKPLLKACLNLTVQDTSSLRSGILVHRSLKKKCVLVSFPVGVTKQHKESNLREKGLFSSQFQVPALHGGEAEAAGA